MLHMATTKMRTWEATGPSDKNAMIEDSDVVVVPALSLSVALESKPLLTSAVLFLEGQTFM